jgi:hypothetical protein
MPPPAHHDLSKLPGDAGVARTADRGSSRTGAVARGAVVVVIQTRGGQPTATPGRRLARRLTGRYDRVC